MQLDNLLKGKFIKRYKRFLMEVEVAGEIITAHTPNTGTMRTLLDKENFVYLEDSHNPKRKLKYTTQIIEFAEAAKKKVNSQKKRFCLINTHLPNKLVREGIEAGLVESLVDFTTVESEVKYGEGGHSRIDILLNHQDKTKTYIEVKNATLKASAGVCAFPDAQTVRGRKHLEELMREVKKGNRAVGFFMVSRNDCDKFKVAEKVDPKFYETYQEAKKQGVEFLAYTINFQQQKQEQNTSFTLTLGQQIEIIN
jgi:sugar fermentation stimulation protein A